MFCWSPVKYCVGGVLSIVPFDQFGIELVACELLDLFGFELVTCEVLCWWCVPHCAF